VFSLIVDDFGVKYVGQEQADHLYQTLQKKYTVTADWTGSTFLGMHLEWNYEQHTVDISMLNYIRKALQHFQHQHPKRPEHTPHKYLSPQYGAAIQYTPDEDYFTPLTRAETQHLQEVVGTFLYYARAIDNTMLVALGSLAAAQANGTE
jgi:hypothetical protein